MSSIFEFQVSPLELLVRGSLMYWFLFLLFRFILRRDAGSLGLADILVIVLIADASQNGMSGEYKSVSEAMVLVGTIAGWNYLFDWLSVEQSLAGGVVFRDEGIFAGGEPIRADSTIVPPSAGWTALTNGMGAVVAPVM